MSIFTTIAVSMVSLAALVLTITMVVVQLAMGQFSPRIGQTFLRDVLQVPIGPRVRARDREHERGGAGRA